VPGQACPHQERGGGEREGHEAYDINSCDDFPGGASGANLFSAPTVRDGNGNPISPSWAPCNFPTQCEISAWDGMNCNFLAAPFFGSAAWALYY
jgi:hypothetical protein